MNKIYNTVHKTKKLPLYNTDRRLFKMAFNTKQKMCFIAPFEN